MIIDIKTILQEIAQNEHDSTKSFRERFVEYNAKKDNTILAIYRILRCTELKLNDCLCGEIEDDIDRAIIIKVLKIIRIEVEIIRYMMKYPEVFYHIAIKPSGK